MLNRAKVISNFLVENTILGKLICSLDNPRLAVLLSNRFLARYLEALQSVAHIPEKRKKV